MRQGSANRYAEFPRLRDVDDVASAIQTRERRVRAFKLANRYDDREPVRASVLSRRRGRAKGPVMKFSMQLSPKIEHVMWGAVGGAIALAAIGFGVGGWVTGGKAAELSQQKADKAVVAVLAPICVDKFRHAKNADDNLGKLNAISYSWEKGTYVSQGGWATLPGNTEPNSAVAQACAEMLSNVVAKQ